jgi:hypothetical protein
MNKNILYIFIALIIFAVGCTEDDEPLAEFKKSKYDLSQGEEGSVQRDIYDIYTNYNCLLLLEADSSDYKYNFENQNNIKIVNSDEAYHKAGINFFKEVWLDKYNEEFKKKNLPFSIILCNKIINSKNQEVNVYTGHGFVAIAGINENLAGMTDEAKKSLYKEINFNFWGYNMMQYRQAVKLPNRFYAVSKAMYLDQTFEWDFDNIYKLGFVSTDWPRPSIEQDGVDYMRFITMSTQDYINTMTSKFPKIKEKYDIIKTYFADTYKIDILDFTK